MATSFVGNNTGGQPKTASYERWTTTFPLMFLASVGVVAFVVYNFVWSIIIIVAFISASLVVKMGKPHDSKFDDIRDQSHIVVQLISFFNGVVALLDDCAGKPNVKLSSSEGHEPSGE